ncbi:hypothetical protein BsWGS_07418 [Bradybaena similaris]
MQTEVNSDTDQSKQSLSPKFACQHGDLSELSFFEDNASPAGQRVPKSYRKGRPASAPRAYVTETNIWREFSLPSYCMPDYRRAPAMYIDQDIINKQRQEIQLLMEELGNRDQELTDLVMSHQKQVKAWECDNEKNRALQAKLTHYEDELRSKEEQLKRVLVELASVNDQREVDVKELKRTQNEMVKLTERVLENSIYIKEMEAQNQKLNSSLREFANTRQALRAREQELVALVKDKEFRVQEKQQELDKQAEYIKVLESQSRDLAERNNNMNEESINWRKKYGLLKEETERLNDDCKKKEENIQKMTSQLHESLQQAIALQKALFTSCEREKCKEEVMYSLRRQHKRTMQELQNIRELYDRLTRDTTMYHLSIKDKEFSSEGKKSEEEYYEEDGKKKKHTEHIDKWHLDRRKPNINLSVNKHKQLEGNCESFLLKESKERKHQSRESKYHVMSEEDSVENNTEEEDKNGNVSMNYSRTTDRSKVRATKDASQRVSPNVASSRLKNGRDSNKVGFTNQTSIVDAGCSKLPAKGFGNRSRNSESRITKSPCHSPLSDCSEKSQKANPVSFQDVVGDVTPETAATKPDDKPQKETSHKDLTAQPQGSTAYESKPSRTMAVGRKDDMAKREQEERLFHTSDEPAAATKQLNKKKSVEFDVPDKVITSCNRQMQAESHCMCSESDSHLQQAHKRQDSSTANISSACQNKCQPSRQQADGVSGGFPMEREEKRKNSPMRMCEDALQESKFSDKECSQRGEKWHELGQDCRPRESENPETEFKMKPMEMHEHQLRHEVCDQCRSKGKRVCDCSRTPRSCVGHSKPLTVTFAPEVSSCDKSYPCQQESVSHTSKFSFMEMDSHMEYGSSVRESENSREFSKREFSEGPLTYPPMTMLKNDPSHQSSKKIQFSLPSVDSFYNQNQHHKTTCDDLPDEVLAYLARQRCFRPEMYYSNKMYYNNNNRSDNHLHDPAMAADSSDSDHQCCSGQSLSKSGHALSSNGQSAYQSELRPVSDEKSQRTLLNKEESVFVQKNRPQNQDHFRIERRGNMLDVGNKDVTDNHKRHDDNTNRCDDRGKTSSDAIQRFDVKRFGGNYKRSGDIENKCVGNNRLSDDSHRKADDCLKTFDDTQRRYDDNQPRFCENGCDNSANNSNTESATFCSQSLSCDMMAAVAREKTLSDSQHGLSLLKKIQHSQEKKLEIKGEFHYKPNSQETQNDVRNSIKESYFCPEESEPDNEGCANSKSLADDKKAQLAHVRTCHVSLKLAQFKTGGGLLLQKHTSWHRSEMPQVVQTILPSTNRDGSGAQNDKSGTIASLGQVESDCRSCEMESKSGVTTISGRGRSESRFCVLEGSNTMSSRHRNSRSCEQDARSARVLSLTQKQLESRTFEQAGDSFSMYSPQEQSNTQSLQLKSRSDVTSRDQERSSSNRLQPKDKTSNTVPSIHKQANNGFCDLHHTTREDSDNSKHDTCIMTPHVIAGQCESPYSGNSNQQDISSDQSSGEMSTGGVRHRSCNNSLEEAHHGFRNCCFSSEIVKSNSALRSDKSCVLGRDIENANKNNNTDNCNCSHENCLCSG